MVFDESLFPYKKSDPPSLGYSQSHMASLPFNLHSTRLHTLTLHTGAQISQPHPMPLEFDLMPHATPTTLHHLDDANAPDPHVASSLMPAEIPHPSTLPSQVSTSTTNQHMVTRSQTNNLKPKFLYV